MKVTQQIRRARPDETRTQNPGPQAENSTALPGTVPPSSSQAGPEAQVREADVLLAASVLVCPAVGAEACWLSASLPTPRLWASLACLQLHSGQSWQSHQTGLHHLC